MMKRTEFYGKKSPRPRIFFLGLVLVILSALVVLALRLDDEEDEWTYDMGLPIILIDTGGETLDPNVEMEETMVNGEPMMLYGNSERYKASLKLYYRDPYDFGDKGVRPEMETDVVMNVRGQSSLTYPKKQYTLRFVDEMGFENPKEVLKMPKHDKWVLNGMYSDKSLLRNYLAYKMGRQTMEYSPDTRFVEVYIKKGEELSREDDYMGIFLLTEKIERGVNRVPIGKNNSAYGDTSFIMARDKIKAGDTVINSKWNSLEEDYVIIPKDRVKLRTLYTVSYPSGKNITEEDEASMLRTIDDFEYALRSSNFRDRDEGYRAHIDLDSFVKFAMINEITKNIDGGEVSSYFYKDLGSKIKAGPLWDFDMSMGNTYVEEVNEPEGFLIIDTIWFNRLFQDQFFVNRYKNIYRKYRSSIWNDNNINAMIDGALIELSPAISRNNEKWFPEDAMEDYIREVEELRGFLLERLHWMDENINLIKRITDNVVE